MANSPIDSIIRSLIIKELPSGSTVPETDNGLDPTPKLIMEPGPESFSFRYEDNFGDGREEKYDGYADAGPGAEDSSEEIAAEIAATVPTTKEDFFTANIPNPENKTYILMFNIPFDVVVIGVTYQFGTGPGLVTGSTGEVTAGSNYEVTVSGADETSTDLVITVHLSAPFVYDFITVNIPQPENKAYIVMFNVPFEVEIVGSSGQFGAGPGSFVVPTGIVETGNNLELTISGADETTQDFVAHILTKINSEDV